MPESPTPTDFPPRPTPSKTRLRQTPGPIPPAPARTLSTLPPPPIAATPRRGRWRAVRISQDCRKRSPPLRSLASQRRTINEKQLAGKAFVTCFDSRCFLLTCRLAGNWQSQEQLVLCQLFHRAEQIIGLRQDGVF